MCVRRAGRGRLSAFLFGGMAGRGCAAAHGHICALLPLRLRHACIHAPLPACTTLPSLRQAAVDEAIQKLQELKIDMERKQKVGGRRAAGDGHAEAAAQLRTLAVLGGWAARL